MYDLEEQLHLDCSSLPIYSHIALGTESFPSWKRDFEESGPKLENLSAGYYRMMVIPE